MRDYMQTESYPEEVAKMMNALQNQYAGQDWELHGCIAHPALRKGVIIIHSRRSPQ